MAGEVSILYRWQPKDDLGEEQDEDDEGWWDDDELDSGMYQRTRAEARRPLGRLHVSGPQPVTCVATDLYLERLSPYLGAGQVDVELVPEPGNHWDDSAVAVDLEGNRIGYLPRGTAEKRHEALASVNREGNRVLATASIEPPEKPGADSPSVVLALPYPHSLGIWLTLPEPHRTTGFREPWEIRRMLTNQFQHALTEFAPEAEGAVHSIGVDLEHVGDRLNVLAGDSLVGIVPADSPDYLRVRDTLTESHICFRLYIAALEDGVMAKVQVWEPPEANLY